MSIVVVEGKNSLRLVDGFLTIRRRSKSLRPTGDLFEGAVMVDVKLGGGSGRTIRRPVWVSQIEDGVQINSCDAVTKGLIRYVEKKTGLKRITVTPQSVKIIQ